MRKIRKAAWECAEGGDEGGVAAWADGDPGGGAGGADEVGVKGPVESRRGRAEDTAAIERTLERWKGRGVRLALVVRLDGGEARAEGWSR